MTPLPSAPQTTETPPDPLPEGWTGPGAPPLELDIGCRKGRFLVAMAGLHPERNFLGVERQGERVEKTQKKMRTLALPNVGVIRADALELVRALGSGVVDRIHVLFPDPWPKRRHHCRRLVQRPFLEQCLQILKPQGRLRLVTDDADYAVAMREVVAEFPEFAAVGLEDEEFPPTEFQLKFLDEARPIYSLLLERVGVNSCPPAVPGER